MKTVVHAACSHDCPDACGVLITIDDGRAVKIQGDPAHPVTEGFLCAKVAKYLDRVYAPDRVLYPMRRIAPKGQGGFDKFERISWDVALDEISTRFRKIAEKHGSEAILPYSYGGTLGALNNASMDRRFFHRLGASQLERSICSAAGEAGLLSVYGAKYGTEPEQFRHSKYIIAWGANIHGNNVHLWPFIEEARRNGAKLVVIDPYKTRTASLADWYIPIAPGTDVVLVLGMMHVIIAENLYDADYVAKGTIGFAELRKRAAEYPPERVAKLTGIPALDVINLAREYSTTRPAAIRLNYGIQRAQNGGMATRAVAMLPCLVGSWKEVGGGLQMSLSGAYPHDKESLRRADLMNVSLGRPARTINMVELGKALTEVDDPPVKALFVYHSNPAAVCPDHNKVVRGLMRDDLFTVVHEQFLTDTTDYADLVLPATTFFEHKDLQTAYGHYFLQLSNQAIEPLGECRSNVDMFRAFAERMGFTEECFGESVDEMIDSALSTNHPWLEGITRERLEREGHIRLNLPKADTSSNGYFLPFADGKFSTSSGKAEFYSASMAARGLDPVLSFVPPCESRNAKHGNEYPLEMLARKADNFLNSSFCNHSSHRPLEKGRMGVLEISREDADPRRISDGDAVEVFNSRGSIALTARIANSVKPGLISARLDWAKLSKGGVNVNVLTSDRLTDMGAGATFYSTLVEVRRTRSKDPRL